MTAPAFTATGHHRAALEQRQAARDHLTQLRQQGWTYRSIADATALSPNTVYDLATGRRTGQPATATAVLKVTSRILSGSRLLPGAEVLHEGDAEGADVGMRESPAAGFAAGL